MSAVRKGRLLKDICRILGHDDKGPQNCSVCARWRSYPLYPFYEEVFKNKRKYWELVRFQAKKILRKYPTRDIRTVDLGEHVPEGYDMCGFLLRRKRERVARDNWFRDVQEEVNILSARKKV